MWIGVVISSVIGVVALICVIGVSLNKSSSNIYKDCNQIVNLEYKSVEGTGYYGRAEYYAFDSKGNRFKISQQCFDSLVNIPRR